MKISWLYRPFVLGLLSVIPLCFFAALAGEYIPREYHPHACAVAATGLLFLAVSRFMVKERTYSLTAMAWTWIAFVVAIYDHACVAAFLTSLSIAILATSAYVKQVESYLWHDTDSIVHVKSMTMACIGWSAFIVAFYVGMFPL